MADYSMAGLPERDEMFGVESLIAAGQKCLGQASVDAIALNLNSSSVPVTGPLCAEGKSKRLKIDNRRLVRIITTTARYSSF